MAIYPSDYVNSLFQPTNTANKLLSSNIYALKFQQASVVANTTAALAVGDIIPLAPIATDAVAYHIYLANTAFGGSCAGNLGLYYAPKGQGPYQALTGPGVLQVVNANLFSPTPIAISAAATFTDRRYSTTLTEAGQTRAMWQLLGLSANPTGNIWNTYYICFTVTTAGSATSGSLSMQLQYGVGD